MIFDAASISSAVKAPAAPGTTLIAFWPLLLTKIPAAPVECSLEIITFE